ncbi:hypothetical protein ISCGN_004782 [Ixodes scapularis]
MFGHLSSTGIPWRYKKRLLKAYRNCTSDLIGNIRVVCDQLWGNVLGQDFRKAKDYKDWTGLRRIDFERLWYVKRRLVLEGIGARKSNTGFAPKKSNIGQGSAAEHGIVNPYGTRMAPQDENVRGQGIKLLQAGEIQVKGRRRLAIDPHRIECSHAKSELLVKRGYHERILKDEVQVLVNGNRISESDSVRVLGMHLRKDLSSADAVLRIGKTAKSTARLIRRIANKRGGVKEDDVCRIVHVLVVSRVLYTVPYMRLTITDKNKRESIIRQAYKLALGLPMATSTDRFMQLGIHNTVPELVEAHRSSQIFDVTSGGSAFLSLC